VNLEHIAITLRPRTVWQCVDLGVVLARRWYWPLCRLWLATALPVLVLVLLLGLVLPGSLDSWVFFLFWLLQPLCEGPMIRWVGLALFGDQLPVRRVLQDFRSSGKRPSWWGLLLCRLRPSRPMALPILLLEGLQGRARTDRLAVLCRRSDGGLYLSLAGLMIELLLAYGLLMLLLMLIPEELRWFEMRTVLLSPSKWLFLACFASASCFFTPFYLCSGFMLYIGQRVVLEGWDLEVGFRALNDRLGEDRR
jgi:hypothetical protein